MHQEMVTLRHVPEMCVWYTHVTVVGSFVWTDGCDEGSAWYLLLTMLAIQKGGIDENSLILIDH